MDISTVAILIPSPVKPKLRCEFGHAKEMKQCCQINYSDARSP